MSDEATFYEHLDELIRRLNVCLAAIICFSILSLPLVPRVLDIMKELFLPEGTTLIVVDPFENIMVFFELALVLGLLFSSPVMIYEALKFIFPALYQHERKLLITLLPLGIAFFILGVMFGAKLILPFIYEVCYAISPSGVIWFFSLRAFVEYTLLMVLGFGVAFELPLVIGILASANVVPVKFFKENRIPAYIILLLIGVMVLTPETTTPLDFLVGLLLIGLYELEILISRLIMKIERRGNVS